MKNNPFLNQLNNFVQQIETRSVQKALPYYLKLDPHLFNEAHKQRDVRFYVEEIKHNLARLENLLQPNEAHLLQTSFLIQKIQQQLIALHQTLPLLVHKKKQKAPLYVPNETLAQRQARYRGYYVQLKQKREDLLLQTHTQAQRDHIEQRLAKCQQALLDLERQMERRSK